MKRAEIIVEEYIQKAGYRAYVMKSARKLSLAGYVENLPDSTVRIVCERESEKIKKFIATINIKTETIEVARIKVNYESPTGEFEGKGFVVKIADLRQELFQGFATAAKYFGIGYKKQDAMFEKQDTMIEKQDKTLQAIEGMHTDMNKRFDEMIRKTKCDAY